MSTITLAWAPAEHALSIKSNDEVSTMVTGATQVQGRTGSRFQLAMTWRRGGDDAAALRGQLASLNAMRNRLLVPLSKLGYVRRGSGGTTATVHGAHLAGQTTLTMRGLPPASNNISVPGDYLTIGTNGQLLQATSALNTSGSPNTRGTVNIWPPLTKNRADGTTVLLSAPTGLFMMTNDFGFSTEPMPALSNWYAEIMAEFMEDVLA